MLHPAIKPKRICRIAIVCQEFSSGSCGGCMFHRDGIAPVKIHRSATCNNLSGKV